MKREWDTPNKSRPSILDACFGSSRARYVKEDYALISLIVSDVLSSGDKYCTAAAQKHIGSRSWSVHYETWYGG